MSRRAKYATLTKYQPYIDIVMDDLGLTDKIVLDWVFGKWEKMGGDAILYTRVHSDGKRYGRVRVDKTSTHAYILGTIMHELKHIQQNLTERLTPSYSQIVKTKRGNYKQVWKTKWLGIEHDFYTTSNNPQLNRKYMNQPWEVEAYKYQREVPRLFPNNTLPLVPERKYIGAIGKVKFYKVKG